jgi:hypothetical protein
VEEGLKEMEEEMEEEGERNSILGGVENLGMEDFHGKGCKEWKKMYVPLCMILMEDG